MTQTTVKKLSAGKSLCLFTNIFDAKNRTVVRRIGAAESKRRSFKAGFSLWTDKTKKGHSKINDQVKRIIYT